MIFSRLANIELEKGTSHSVGSSDFISSNRLKTFSLLSNVSDVLMELQYNLPNPTLDFSEPYVESAELYLKRAESYAESAGPHAKSSEPYARSSESYAESTEPCVRSTHSYAKSAEPYVNLYITTSVKVKKTVYDIFQQ